MGSRHTDRQESIKFAVLSLITGTKPATKLDTSSWRFPTDIKLADENFNLPGDFELLLGADLFYEMLRTGRLIRPCFPVIQKRVLGWNLSGTIRHYITLTNFILFAPRRQQSKAQTQSLLGSGRCGAIAHDSRDFEQHFSSHTNQQINRRFVNRLPKKLDPKQLGSTRLSAEQRLHATERRLEQDPDFNVQYHNFMNIYKELVHMELVTSQEGKETFYFLPYHPVFKESVTITETKVLFDESAKTSNGLSLKGIFQVGPNVQQVFILLNCGSEPVSCASQLT